MDRVGLRVLVSDLAVDFSSGRGNEGLVMVVGEALGAWSEALEVVRGVLEVVRGVLAG